MSAQVIPFPTPTPEEPPLPKRLAARRAYRTMASAAAIVAMGQAFDQSLKVAATDKATAQSLLLDDAVPLFLAAMRRELRKRIQGDA